MGGGSENERRRDVQKAYKKRVRGRSRILLEQISALVPKQDGGGGLRRVHEILRDTLVFAQHILKRDQKTIIECLTRLEAARRLKGHLDPMERISLDDVRQGNQPGAPSNAMLVDIQTTLPSKTEPQYPSQLDVLARGVNSAPSSFLLRSTWDFTANLNSEESSKIASPVSPTRGVVATPHMPTGAGIGAAASSSIQSWLGIPSVGLKSSGSGDRLQDFGGSSSGARPSASLPPASQATDLKVQQARYVQNLIETAKAMLHGPASATAGQLPAHQPLYHQIPVPSTTAAPAPGHVGAVQTHFHHQHQLPFSAASPRPTLTLPGGGHLAAQFPSSPMGAAGPGGGFAHAQALPGVGGGGWLQQATEKPQPAFDPSSPVANPHFMSFQHRPPQ